MDIGFIGVGNMGAGMANNLLKAGHSLTIHELVRERATPLLEQGAKWADSPREVAEASEITFTSLPGPLEVEAVALGEGGVLEGSRPGTVYVDLSSNAVSVVRRLYDVFKAHGVDMLDAPVSGGVAGARSGRLAIMVGGDEAAYRRVKPALDDFGDNVVYCGGIGSGSVCKLMHNCIVAVTSQAISECFTLGAKAGVDIKPLWETVRRGRLWSGGCRGSPVAQYLVQRQFRPGLGTGLLLHQAHAQRRGPSYRTGPRIQRPHVPGQPDRADFGRRPDPGLGRRSYQQDAPAPRGKGRRPAQGRLPGRQHPPGNHRLDIEG